MLPVILIVAAAALITACESGSTREKNVKRGSFKPMEETYTGLDLDSSSYRGESKSKRLMKKIQPGTKKPPKKNDGKGSGAKPKPIGGNTGNPAIKKCESDGHDYSSLVDSSGERNGVCKNAKGKSCGAWAYFRGECSLD